MAADLASRRVLPTTFLCRATESESSEQVVSGLLRQENLHQEENHHPARIIITTNEARRRTIAKNGASRMSTEHSSICAGWFPLIRRTSDSARTKSSGWPSSTSDCSNQYSQTMPPNNIFRTSLEQNQLLFTTPSPSQQQ